MALFTGEARVSLESAVPQFTVPDVLRTAEYYRDVLGFRVSGYWDGESAGQEPAGQPRFGIVERDRIQIFFNRADEASSRPVRAVDAYDVYIRVHGLDALAGELRNRGADIVEGPEDRVYGQRELVVRDCNGLIIAFGEEART